MHTAVELMSECVNYEEIRYSLFCLYIAIQHWLESVVILYTFVTLILLLSAVSLHIPP
jgi:hypothetical protein